MDNKPNKTFGAILGTIFGQVIVTCLFLCLSAVVVTATIKFIMWII